MNKKIFVFFTVMVLFFSINPSVKGAEETSIEPQIQVKLVNYLDNPTQLSLKVNGSYQLIGTSTVLVSDRTYLVKVEIDSSNNSSLGLYDGGEKLAEGQNISIEPINEDSTASINNREYMGGFRFTLENEKYVRPINKIYLEDYLKSVVPAEMYASWSKEALKVQAIAARTYAYLRKDQIIDDTTRYQAYAGTERLHFNSNAAVEETVGEVLQYNGRLIDAVYSASNGGMTESNSNEWGSTHLPYFPIQKDDYDQKIKWYASIHKQQIDTSNLDLTQPNKWWDITTEINNRFAANLKSWLGRNGYSNKQLKIVTIPKLEFYSETESGRVSRGDLTVQFFVKDQFDDFGKLELQTKEINYVTADTIRSFIGKDIMTSTLINDSTETNEIYSFSGTGNGHGVGMSQHGANNRANAGQSYKNILSFYYPGTEVSKKYVEHVGTPNYPVVKVQLNGQDFTAGYKKDSTTYVYWRALEKLNIIHTYKGYGLFTIEGREVQGEYINGKGPYIQWSQLAPGRITYENIDGGFNFIYFPTVKVQLNGVDFTTGYKKDGTTYVYWKALETFKVPHTYKGYGLFEIEGRKVQGEYFNGTGPYIRWNQLSPNNVTYSRIEGGYNFIHNGVVTVKVQLNGENFISGYKKDGTTYVYWRALEKLNIPHSYKGYGLFNIGGRDVQGEYFNGTGPYIHWSQLAPGEITYVNINGGFNFIYNK